jgi:hypothetical protein
MLWAVQWECSPGSTIVSELARHPLGIASILGGALGPQVPVVQRERDGSLPGQLVLQALPLGGLDEVLVL